MLIKVAGWDWIITDAHEAFSSDTGDADAILPDVLNVPPVCSSTVAGAVVGWMPVYYGRSGIVGQQSQQQVQHSAEIRAMMAAHVLLCYCVTL